MAASPHLPARALAAALAVGCAFACSGGGGSGGGPASSSPAAGSRAADPTVHVFLLGGQSNMLGVGRNAALSPPLSLPQLDVLFFHYGPLGGAPHPPDGGLEMLQPGRGANPNKFGPEVAFGRALADTFPERRFALVKYASGGTNLHRMWNPETGPNLGPPNFEHKSYMYANFHQTVEDALAALAAEGYDFEIRGMLWLQGERDVAEGRSGEYGQHLDTLLAAVRAQWGADLPFLAAGIREVDAGSAEVIAATRDLADSDPRVAFADTTGLQNEDLLHFDSVGLVGVGRGLAAAYASLLSPAHTTRTLTTADRGDGAPGLAADASVREHEPDSEQGCSMPVLVAARSSTGHETVYLRFDLSRLRGIVLDALLEIDVRSGSGDLHVYGLNDDDPDEAWPGDALSYAAEVGMLVGDGDTATVDVDDDDVLEPELSRARHLGTLHVGGPGIETFAVPALANFLREDSNGLATLVLEAAAVDGPPIELVAAEGALSGAGEAPTLAVDLARWACSDGLDQDFDGRTDYPADPDCVDELDQSE